ncbi:MAG TPA: PPC domain-containing DNA-binding protein [Nocardioidaceae bacterium]|nr:PPC domain-containing DNA-binding protein [Nocardioidaceae bacterium]
MKSRTFTEGELRTIVAVFDAGDEILEGLASLARDESLAAASLTAIGAVSAATLGWYDLDAQEYREIPVREQAEVLSLVGDVVRGPDGGPAVHCHGVLGLPDGSTRGGHLLHGTVRPTLEVVLTESPAQLHKTFRPEFGLALIDLDA